MSSEPHEEGSHGGGGGHSSTERYLVTYADLLTLLLAFFIVMWATSKADLEKFAKIAAAFNQVLGGSGASLTVEGEGSNSGSVGLLSGGGNLVFPQISQRSRDFAALSQQISDYAQQAGIQPDIGINMRREGIVITLSNALLFGSGNAEISEASLGTLRKLAELLAPLPNEIRVEAHTDNIPTEDLSFTNWELSALRAAAVVRFFVEQGGISPERLTAAGMGESHPLFPNDTPEHRRLNRRADIVILYPQDEASRVFNVLSLPEIRPPSAPLEANPQGTGSEESAKGGGS